MISWGRHSERITAAATALVLQAGLYLALSPRLLFVPRASSAPTLVAMIMTATRPTRAPPPPLSPINPRAQSLAIEPPVVQPITPPMSQARASRSAIDWQAAIQREVGAELSRANARPGVRFGFPQMPAETDAPPAFGWDEAHIDRVQRLEHGVIDLGPCVITLAFPIPICHFGSGGGNGDLLKRIEPRSEPPGSPP
jgi:hypothetical protein